MARTLSDLLSELPEQRRQEYLRFSDDIQSDIAQHIEETGSIPPPRKLPILFGLECATQAEPYRWMGT